MVNMALKVWVKRSTACALTGGVEKIHARKCFSFRAIRSVEIFEQAYGLSNLAIKAVIEAYDFSRIETLVDIAGGHGRLLTAILEVNPTVKGVLFDMPHVIAGAKEKKSLGSRLEFTSGDFFAEVPAGADAYMMKHIIHDWDDERALQILSNIRKAMNPNGRVLLVESVITQDGARLRQTSCH